MRVPKLVPNLIVITALAALVAIGGSPPAYAGGKNQIRGVAIRDDAGATTVRIQGSGTPTFTVYKLERPTRVVVDVAQATLDRSVRGDEPSATFAVGSWAVSQVAAMAMEDGSTSVRVVVTLARPGRYDVKAEGKDVVVKVTARDPAPAVASNEELAAARLELEAARRAADIEQKKAKDAMAAAAAAKQAAEEATRAAAKASSSDRATADQRVAEAKAAAARAEANAKAAAAQAEAATRAAKAAAAEEVARARSAADAEIAKAKTAADAEVAKATAARAEAEARAAKADAEVAKAKTAADAEIAKARAAAAADRAAAERDREAAAKARAEAERTMADAKAKLAKVETDRKRIESEARAAEQRERDARAAEQQAASERKAAQEAVARAEAERMKAAGATRAQADEKIKDAEARLARAEAARLAAENARKDAEKAAGMARQEAERAAAVAKKDAAAAKAAIAAAESQRAAAEQRKADTLAEAERAETRRAQAESQRARAEAEAARAAELRRAEEAAAKQAAATRRLDEDAAKQAAATRRTDEAAAQQAAAMRKSEEAAAARAASARKTEEAAAAQAASARKTEEAAAARARAAREAEEQAMQAAASARSAAEARKQAAEKAADDAERAVAMERDAAKVARARKRAAEDAEAEARAAARRKASADEIAAARAEAARLVAEREKAERELADRTRDVARTRTEAERLAAAKTAAAKEAERLAAERATATAEVARMKQEAAEAREARAREEARLAEVTKARAAEEKALARVRSAPAPVPVATNPATKPAPAPVPPERAKRVEGAKPTAKIAAVRFAPADNEHTVVVDIDGKGATAELVRTGTRKAELVVHGATLSQDLARTLDTSRFGGPIRAVSSYTDPKTGDVRVVVELTSDVTPRFDTSGGDLRLAFAASPRVRTQSVPGPVVGGFGATSTPVTQTSVAQLGKKKVYRGPTIELDFKDADIHDLLRTLADVGRVNIVVPEEVNARVTVRMKRVPWDQALDVILASKGLGYRKEGNLYRVAPQKQLDAEDEAEAARLRALVDMEAPKPEVYTLNYTDAESVKPTLEPLLSPKGKIEVDKRTNSIVVNDVSRNRREIIDLATRLDTQTPQISIEARIVEARSQYERQIGIQWGGRALAGAAGGNATGLIFPSTVGLTGGANDPNKPEDGVATPADFAVNLPVGGTQGALGLTLGSVGGNVNINLRLSALEETGTVRIISAPKVTVLNNIEAEMKQGVKIPISIVSAEGTQTQFVRAELSLKVTPYVSQRDCAIMMDVQVTKDEPDFVNTGARGDPTILNKEAKTRMLVNDGETSVMGGIYTRNSGLSYSKIPFFADIPVFGWLFKRRIETDDRAELLIFITPKITNKASLRCAP